MMNTINCDVCHQVIAYTNRTIKKRQTKYLKSDKLTNNQKWAIMQNSKLIYCVKCYNKGIKEAKAEVKTEWSI